MKGTHRFVPTRIMDTNTNRVERRQWESQGYRSRPNGRSFALLRCPFCQTVNEASVWSIRGSGKRCEGSLCGAFFNGWGDAFRLTDEFRLVPRRKAAPSDS